MTGLQPFPKAMQPDEIQTTEELLPLVYAELRRLAAHKMASENPGQTLQPTALVHEAWLKLGGEQNRHWQNRNHFFAAAAEVLGISEPTAKRYWSFARAWLYEEIRSAC